MGKRLRLHEELTALAGSSYRIYFQPDVNTRMKYPCVVCTADSGDSLYADNRTWRYTSRYQVTVITRDQDCPLVGDILNHFPMCRMDRAFVKDNLYHNALVLYY